MSFTSSPIPGNAFMPISGGSYIEAGQSSPLLALPDSGSPLANGPVIELPSTYSGGTITLAIAVIAQSATSNNIRLSGAFRSQESGDAITRVFTTAQASTQARGATAANIEILNITFTSAQIDGVAAGEACQIQVGRDNTVGSNASGAAWIEYVILSEA